MKSFILALALSFIINTTVVYSDEIYGNIDMAGFVSQGYLNSPDYNSPASDAKNGTFQFNEMGLTVFSSLNPELKAGLQIISSNFGELYNNDLRLDWAFLSYRLNIALIKIGKLKIPFGFSNETRDIDVARTSIFLPSGVYNETWRETFAGQDGIGVSGYYSGKLGTFDYVYQYGTVNLPIDGGTSKTIQYYNPGSVVNKYEPGETHSAMVNYVFDKRDVVFRLSASLYTNPSSTWYLLDNEGRSVRSETNNMISNVVGASLSYGCFNIISEIYSCKLKAVGYVSDIKLYSKDFNIGGGYIAITYDFPMLAVESYYSILYPNTKDKNGDEIAANGGFDHQAWKKELALYVRVPVGQDLILKGGYHFINGTGYIDPSCNPNLEKENWGMFCFKASLSF